MTTKTNASSSKSPYEIRLTLLQMAQDYLQAQTAIQLDMANKMADHLISTQKATLEEAGKLMPKMYSIEEVVKKANELYGFVQKKD